MVTTTTPTKPISADHPLPGYYAYRRHREAPWEPAFIAEKEGKLICRIANRMEDPHEKWTFLAGNKRSKEDVLYAFKNAGKWPSDPPPVPVVALPEPGGPGHNSGDPSAFKQMRDEVLAAVGEKALLLAGSPLFAQAKVTLEADIAAAKAFYDQNPITTKTDADKAENWRSRIAKAADALDDERKGEKAVFAAVVEEIDGRYFGVIRPAKAYALTLKGLADTWAREETARRQRAAEEQAKKQIDFVRGDENNIPGNSGAPPAPIVAPVEKVLLGTGPQRRSAKASPATAVIVDVVAVAKYYAEQGNSDLIALLQKLANKAVKAGASVPGCVSTSLPATQKQEAAE